MKTTAKAALILAVVSQLFAAPAYAGDKSIYGRDDRIELFEASPKETRLAVSVVSLWMAEDLRFDPAAGAFSFNTRKLSGDAEVCAKERFREQPMGAYCSGSLVGDDLVLTAGHCVRDQAMCDGARIAFGFALKEPGGNAAAGIGKNDVYSCKRILITRSENAPPRPDPYAEYRGPDYALIQLDRKVIGRGPLEINRGRGPKKGDKVTVIGYPLGLPLKIAGGAAVRNASPADYFVTDVDSFHGSSGSPVFNTVTGLIEGILVRGDTDFEVAPGGGCYAMAVYPQNGGRGEDVSRVSALGAFIPAPAAGSKSAGTAFRDVNAVVRTTTGQYDLGRYFNAAFQ